jgi:hypothetical protein
MTPLDVALLGHIDQALAAIDTAVAALTAAGFEDTPFSVEISNATEALARGCVVFSARKPDLGSAHQTLHWKEVKTRVYATLRTGTTPLLTALRATTPVLTGPMGNIEIRYTPDRTNAPAHTSIHFNGRALEADDLRMGILAFAQEIRHLPPTLNRRVSVDGLSRPMIAATMEGVDLFERALRQPAARRIDAPVGRTADGTPLVEADHVPLPGTDMPG